MAWCDLAASRWGDGPAEIVMLHDGLGSIAQWREIPALVHERTGRTVLAYERAGHGSSLPTPTGPWPADWLHREADVLGHLLAEVAIDAPVLVGHSDGGSIALAAAVAGVPSAGVVTLAAHSWVEQKCVDAIVAMRAGTDRWVAGLSRHHDHPGEVFEAWSGVWTSEAFRGWDIRPTLAAIDVPVLVVQGENDEYATADHVGSTVAAIGDNATGRLLGGAGHLLPHQAPDDVVAAVGEMSDATG